MNARPWELIIADLGDAAWDEGTELASMIADECYPTLLDSEYTRRQAAHIVVSLLTDADWRRCIESLLLAVPAPEAAGVDS